MFKNPEKTIKTLLYLTVLTPLIFIDGFFYPFIITKVLYFRFLIQLAFSVYLFLLVKDFQKYKPRFNLGFILFGGLVAINFLAAFFGLDFYRSLVSDFERMEGLLSLIYLSIYLFLLINFFKNKTDWLNFIKSLLASSFLISLYAVAQKFSILNVFQAGTNRAASTIGNAAFLAGFLLLAIGLGLYYLAQEENKKYRNLAIIATALNLFALFLTSTRGAILGLVFGILVFLIINVIFNPNFKIKKISASLILAILIFGGGFYSSRDYWAGSPIELIRRVATINLSDSSVGNRLMVWKIAGYEAMQKPLLGVGPENFNLVFNQYFQPKINEDWFDRTHNIYLDQLMNAGFSGLGIYLAILAYLLIKLFKIRREDYWRFSFLTSLIAAYGVHNFFVFDALSTAFVFLFLLAFISFKAGEEINNSNLDSRLRGNDSVIKILLIIINLALFYYLIFLPFKINRSIYQGYYYILADQEKSYQGFSYALAHKLGQVEAASQLAKVYPDLVNYPETSEENKKKFYDLAVKGLELAIKNYPQDVRAHLFLAELLMNYGQKEDLAKAEDVLKKALALSQNRPEITYLLYNLYLAEDKKEERVQVLKNLAERLPWFGDVKLMLAIALSKDQPELADQYFQESLDLKVKNLEKIIGYLLAREKYAEAIPYYEKLIAERANGDIYRIDLSKMYYLTGDLDKAIEQINILNNKIPEALKDYQDYVNMLTNDYQNQFTQEFKAP